MYSSSYPGTTSLSQESVEDPGNYELAESQDDLSHDSYELLERSDDDYSNSVEYRQRKPKPMNTRSCSLDSGNYLPTDSESDSEKHHKYKSSSDVHQDIFQMDDPRDFPREKFPRKSDGSFYKTFKISSRTSSLDSKSDYYEMKSSKKDKKGWNQSFSSRTSSQESKSDYENKKITITKNISYENIGVKPDFIESRASSLDSKSDYYDAHSRIDEPPPYHHDYDRKIQFERNYGVQKVIKPSASNYDSFPNFRETSHVHSVSLQNVETEQNIRSKHVANLEQNTVPRTHKSTNYGRSQSSFEPGEHRKSQTTHIWPESIAGLPTEIKDWSSKMKMQRSTDTESNIFSFDEDKIQSLQESDLELGMCAEHSSYSIVSAMNKNNLVDSKPRSTFRDVFMEIDHAFPTHQPIERTKSDPNSIANRQRLGSNSRRHMLMHQKSIDLTPAESSDEDYLFKQIPSAPPVVTKYRGTHFELPTAEFGHFDILKREIEGQKTKFEVPKSQFEVLGAKTQSDLVNLPPKNNFDIPYVLHKRHMMNGTSKADNKFIEPEKVVVESSIITSEPKMWKSVPQEADSSDEGKSSLTLLPPPDSEPSSFLFTQNIDLSKIDPVTLEIDKSEPPIQHMASPKRDITKIDPSVMEALSSKLSQIESDSPTSSKTESLKPEQKPIKLQKVSESPEEVKVTRPDISITAASIDIAMEVKTKQIIKPKTELKPKKGIKARMQPNKKGGKNKTKVRITSFSSDDESLDSDDVFGSAEATPTKLEFSPPQSRKELEPILKYESERQSHLQYTMSSTEIEGSPPQVRKSEYLPYDRSLDPNYQTELRRISERSISIPSSEEDFKHEDLNRPVFDPVTPTVIEEEKDAKTISEDITTEITVTTTELPTEINRLEAKSELPATTSESPMVTRKKGQTPLLFAHARLNLSEGSAFTLIQKQNAAVSPTASRRAKSLDAPVISVNKLPPLNAFSSKDDTVEENAEMEEAIEKSDDSITNDEILEKSQTTIEEAKVSEEKIEVKKVEIESKKEDAKEEIKIEVKKEVKPEIKVELKKETHVELKAKPKKQLSSDAKVEKKTVTKTSKTQDQIVPDVIPKKKITSKVATKSTAQKTEEKSKTTVQHAQKVQSKDFVRVVATKEKTLNQKTLPTKAAASKNQKPPASKQKVIKEKISSPKPISSPKSERDTKPTLTAQATLQPPEIVRAKSQEMEGSKKIVPKEKSKSFEKLEFKRMNSKERAKSQEDSDSDIAKRIEKQQMLYETAIKQTKTLKSPVKDVLPVFPTVEETVRVTDGKLEISIDTIENSNIVLEEAIIITKSPKKLDKKLTKSLELNLTGDDQNDDVDKSVKRLGKSLDLEHAQLEMKEFDFKPESIKAVQEITVKKTEELQLPTPVIETSPESDEHVVEQVIEAEVHKEPLENDDKENIVLEGTELDFWLSVDKEKIKNMKLNDITVLKQVDGDFFEDVSKEKPPDLPKEAKSSSESQSLEKSSLGNSLDIKYIDESGDSSHKSEKDAKLIAELQKSIAIDSKLSKKIEKIIKKGENKAAMVSAAGKNISDDNALVRITSEDESLTEVSDLKFETADSHLLGYTENPNKGTLLKLSIERSRSEETVSWVTVECDEFVGTDSFDVEETPAEISEKTLQETETTIIKQGSCEKSTTKSDECSESTKPTLLSTEPKKGNLLKHSSDHSRSSDTTGSWTSGEKDLSPGNIKETGDESSVSCSIAKTIGISQNIEQFESLEQLKTGEESPSKSHKLERTSPIDEESSSASNGFPRQREPGTHSEDNSIKYTKSKYPFEQKWGSDSELSQKIHRKISKKLSSADKNSLSSLDDSLSDKRWSGMGSLDKPTLQSLDKLSTESRNSLDTESSSGSLGIAYRMQKAGEIPVREPSSTWRPFLIESSGSSSLEEGFLPPDHELESQEYFMSRQASGEYSGNYELTGERVEMLTKDEEPYDFQDELSEFPTNFGYPCLTAAIGGIGIGTDMLAGYGTGFLARTLSRISERSTNSENTSLEDDSTKASTQSDSVNDESVMSSDHQASLSSDSPSGKICSDGDKKKSTSSSGKKQDKQDSSGNSKQSPDQNMVNINNLLLHRQMSDDRRTSAEMADLSIDDIEIITSERGLKLKRQDSDDTIIDEENDDLKQLKPSSSQESEGDWPLPEIPVKQSESEHVEKYITNIPKSFGLRGSLKSQDSEQWPSPPSSLLETPVVDSVEGYYMCPPEEPCKVTVDSNTDPYDSSEENKTIGNEDLGKKDDEKISSNSDSLSGGKSGIKIVLEGKSADSHSSNSEDLNVTLNDDVFTDVIIDTTKNELRPPTVLRRSTASDDSSKGELKPPSPRHSHSSYSEEECTSSLGTNFEEGTVRFALKPTKCTHSSHSEDTSVALSLSEWSNSTNTVKFQNLSSNNSCTKSTSNNSGLKSDDNSLTEMAQSISDWSSSNTNSNTLVAQQSSSLQFQKLSSTSESNTLTEKIPTISEWSSSDTTIVPTQPCDYNVNTINIEGCLEQLLEDDESVSHGAPRSPDNIPSEDLSHFSLEDIKFTKSTERPITFNLPHLLSDTESTSSREIIHQHSLKSTERPVRVPLKFSKCSPYYSSSLSSESTSAAVSKPINIKTATIPLTRTHRKSLPKNILQTKSPPSENDSTSSVESPIGTPEARTRGHRRRRQVASKRHRLDKERSSSKDEFSEPERFMCGKDFSDLPSDYEYKSDIIRRIYSENVEEGYFPDGDSQSGSDIFRIENDGEFEEGLARFENMPLDGSIETFDVSSIPPPLLEDDFEDPDEEI